MSRKGGRLNFRDKGGGARIWFSDIYSILIGPCGRDNWVWLSAGLAGLGVGQKN